MKVYVVICNGWEDSWVQGVFSTEEKAQQFIKDNYETDSQIQDWEIDNPDRD